MAGRIYYMEIGASRKRVLVTDDEDDVRRLVRVLLERAGHTVLEAPTARIALWLHHAQRPDLVILDLVMPDVDGWETLARIRETSDVPILVLSGGNSELLKVR